MLQNVAVLDDASTISSLVRYNLTVTVPMVQTNIFEPTYERSDCDFGWGRTMGSVSLTNFVGHPDINKRIRVSFSFAQYCKIQFLIESPCFWRYQI